MEYVNYTKRIIRKGRKRGLNRDHDHGASDEVCMTSSGCIQRHIRLIYRCRTIPPHTSIVEGLEPQTDNVTMPDSSKSVYANYLHKSIVLPKPTFEENLNYGGDSFLKCRKIPLLSGNRCHRLFCP